MDNSTTYSIYRIVCFSTGKVYVGQTKHITNRQAAHFQKLRRNNHHSQKLQAAYNKYGEHAFFSDIIERNITPDKINEREVHWIAFYDSFHNGYNMTPGGQDSGGNYKSVVIGNTQYSSKQAASDATGLSIREIDVHLRNQGVALGNYKAPARKIKRSPQKSNRNPSRDELTEMAIRLGILRPSGE